MTAMATIKKGKNFTKTNGRKKKIQFVQASSQQRQYSRKTVATTIRTMEQQACQKAMLCKSSSNFQISSEFPSSHHEMVAAVSAPSGNDIDDSCYMKENVLHCHANRNENNNNSFMKIKNRKSKIVSRKKNSSSRRNNHNDNNIYYKTIAGDNLNNSRKYLNKRLTQGCTSLMYACQQGYTSSVVEELRTKPEKVYARDSKYKNALHYCCSYKNGDLVAAASLTVAAPELLESADEDGFTPLHLAVIQGNLPMVNLLLANKADVNAVDNEGHSVVHWATVCGEVEALRSVLQAGATVATPDINGGTPLHYAAQMCGANYDGKVVQASSKLALEILAILLGHSQSSVDVTDKDGRQPLLWAASAGSAKAVIALVKAGARVESCDKDGLTALHCAASRGHTECIDTLISLCGAPTDLIDSNGCTSLHYAVTLGHADASSRLLDLEADPNRQDRKGRTPAHCGCAKGQWETVKLLKEHGANLWLRNAKGDLPIHEAAASGRRELVEWLLDMKPKQVNTTSNDGRTMLHIAAGNDYTDMCKMLFDYGADVNSVYRTNKGVVMTPLDCALQKGFRSTAKFLQLNNGLPASKLHLSARRPLIISQDRELIKPLKYAEKEEIHDLKERKKYITYLNNSDSNSDDCSCSEQFYKKQHRINHVCRHHKKKIRRRTISCSRADNENSVFSKQQDNRNSDICRSKSNIEIHRKRSRDRNYISDDDDDNDSCEVCCRHKRKMKVKRKDNYFRRSTEAMSSYDDEDNDHNTLNDTNHQANNVADKKLQLQKENKQDTEQTIVTDSNEKQDEKSSLLSSSLSVTKKQSPQSVKYRHTKSSTDKTDIALPTAAALELSDEEDFVNSEVVVTQVQVHQEDENSSMPAGKTNIIENKSLIDEREEIVKEVNDVLQSAVETVENLASNDVVLIENVENNVESNMLAPANNNEGTVTAEENNINLMSVTEDAIVGETAIQDFNDIVKTSTNESAIQGTNEIILEITKDEDNDRQNEDVQISEKPTTPISPAKDVIVTAEKEKAKETPVDLSENMKAEKSPLKSEAQSESHHEQESRKSFTLLPPNSPSEFLVDSEKNARKSSFTVLKSDESIEHDNLAIQHIESTGHDEKSSFQVVSNTPVQIGYSSEEVIDGRHSVAKEELIDCNNGRKRRLKRRVKSGVKTRPLKTENDVDNICKQMSKDQDSGFEPSPRVMKTKIQSPRSIYTAYIPRKTIYATLDGRSCSSRAEGRKPGDRNSCSMTAVTKSIHRNIRRYYMERKIFQHLLELKSLQIRSNKINESVLVKRAVDDYHKSCIALGAETGGTLIRRYPYSEYTFKNFEMFLYETLKSLQKPGTYNFQNIQEVYEEAERQLSPEYNTYEKALRCTTKTHRCLHAAHAYTGIPCAAYIPLMNHHTMPKFGFGSTYSSSKVGSGASGGPYKKPHHGYGSFYLPKILTSNDKNFLRNISNKQNLPASTTQTQTPILTDDLTATTIGCATKVSLELSHGKNKKLISLPSDKMDSNKRYYVTFTVKGSGEGTITNSSSIGNSPGTSSKIELSDTITKLSDIENI